MYAFVMAHAEAAQLGLFLAVIASLWSIEHIVLARPGETRLQHGATNLCLVLTALPVEMVLGAACLSASSWAASRGVGIYGPLARAVGPCLANVVVFVALDFLDYVYHRLMHHLPPLWRFHLVHHTDPDVDASTTIREHPGETLVRGGCLVLWTVMLGASFEVLLLRQAAETVSAITSHSAVRLPDRVARLVGLALVTPNLHHVHHHRALPYTDCNFGGVLSIWDRLFGTFAELSEEETVFGLDTHEGAVATRFGDLIAMPFRSEDELMVGVGEVMPADA